MRPETSNMPALLRVGLSLLPFPFAFVSIAFALNEPGWRGWTFAWIVPVAMVAVSAVVGHTLLTTAMAALLGWFAPSVNWSAGITDETINLAFLEMPIVFLATALLTGLVKSYIAVWRDQRERRSGVSGKS
jgi:hypothetical protein